MVTTVHTVPAGGNNKDDNDNYLLYCAQLKHCLPPDGSGTQIVISTEMSDRIKSSIKAVSNAMQVTHNAATQADRALNLQPGMHSLVDSTS